jgi:hypothetical protein
MEDRTTITVKGYNIPQASDLIEDVSVIKNFYPQLD